jgi:hypothetical protein
MRIALVLGCLLVASTVVAKDLVVRQRSSSGSGGSAPNEETVYLAGDKIATDGRVVRTIVDLDKQTITSIDKGKRTYSVMTFADLSAQMAALKKSLEKLPPETRKQMSALFEDGEPVTVTPTGKTDQIAGYSANEYTLAGGIYSGSVWTTDAIPTPPEFQKWKSIEQSRGGAARRLGEAMSQIKGFPLRTRIETKAGPQPVVLSNEVLDVKEATPPAEMLAVPAGFAKQTVGAPPPADAPAK